MPYITAQSLSIALGKLHATADHMLKIWFTLKQMGMNPGHPVVAHAMAKSAGSYAGHLRRLSAHVAPPMNRDRKNGLRHASVM